jgi:hypothetical protein
MSLAADIDYSNDPNIFFKIEGFWGFGVLGFWGLGFGV